MFDYCISPWNRWPDFRARREAASLFLSWQRHETIAQVAERIIKADLPLPDAVRIEDLIDPAGQKSVDRRKLRAVTDVYEANPEWFVTAESLTSAAAALSEALAKSETRQDAIEADSISLAHDLIVGIARVEPAALRTLERLIVEGKDGPAAGIVAKVNGAIAKRLNLPHWWSQDKDFRLVVTVRTREVVFTITDRTATEYSFGERSLGLKHFLSYLVQFLSHEAPAGGRNEILLMDEPDAYLSSQGQQDLVRILEEFASPTTVSRPPAQVVYVTHSPFLIDRNYAHRVRVLDKGVGEEGTRLVRDASHNHYEPLRSSFGPSLAETALIGSANLFVEGLSDQVLLAGMSTRLRRAGYAPGDTFDLNRVTIVQSGGAEHIPYLIYLARGRDVEKPSAVVLLDSDEEGDRVAAALRTKPVGRGELISREYVVQIGSVVKQAREIEDLVPPELAAAAGRRHGESFGVPRTKLSKLSASSVEAALKGSKGTFGAVQIAYRDAYGETARIDKVGFARSLLDVLAKSPDEFGSKELDVGFGALIRTLAMKLRAADRSATEERVERVVDRIKQRFLADHPRRATRNDARLLLEELDQSLGDAPGAEEVRTGLRKLIAKYDLQEEPLDDVPDYETFSGDLVYVALLPRLRGLLPELSDDSQPKAPPPDRDASAMIAARPTAGARPSSGSGAEIVDDSQGAP